MTLINDDYIKHRNRNIRIIFNRGGLKRKIILLRLIENLHLAAQPPPATDPRIRRAIRYLAAHCDQPLSITQFARRSGLSPSHFRRLFRAHTGGGPREFVTGLRMARAKKLLARGVPVKHVAPRVGYADVFYFMRVFRKVTGATPARFARQYP